jgi:prolyl-tRNA editing enzyme YbaK/EbsC (Cys-tRNA(Pro) deacylase)
VHQANIFLPFILSFGDASLSLHDSICVNSVVAPYCQALQNWRPNWGQAMRKAEASAARSVQNVLGPDYEVVEFDESTGTSAEAAAAIGCAVAQIAKSIVFRSRGGSPVLVVASGVNRVDEKKVGALIGEKIDRADAHYVREMTGYAIGGVPPVGHRVSPKVLLDADLNSFESIWAAAGTPNAVFRLTPLQLRSLTGGAFADIAKR